VSKNLPRCVSQKQHIVEKTVKIKNIPLAEITLGKLQAFFRFEN
jgi:hypothetical protein